MYVKDGIQSKIPYSPYRDGGHEREISNAGRQKLDFAEIGQWKPVLLGLSLAGNLVKPLLYLYGTEWRERGYGLSTKQNIITYSMSWSFHA
jgi:hypothetical protein